MQTYDAGIIVCSNDGTFWTGFTWSKQLRNVKVYHDKRYAQKIIDQNPKLKLFLKTVEIQITDD